MAINRILIRVDDVTVEIDTQQPSIAIATSDGRYNNFSRIHLQEESAMNLFRAMRETVNAWEAVKKS